MAIAHWASAAWLAPDHGSVEFVSDAGRQLLHPLLAARWSPTTFDGSASISVAEIEAMLEAARWAPSAGNSQPWAFIVGRRGGLDHDRLVRHLTLSSGRWAPTAGLLVPTWRIASSRTPTGIIRSSRCTTSGKPSRTWPFRLNPWVCLYVSSAPSIAAVSPPSLRCRRTGGSPRCRPSAECPTGFCHLARQHPRRRRCPATDDPSPMSAGPKLHETTDSGGTDQSR